MTWVKAGEVGFGIARDELDISNFHNVRKKVDDNHPFYGIYPNSTMFKCNIPQWLSNLNNKYQNGDAYTFTYDPKSSTLTI